VTEAGPERPPELARYLLDRERLVAQVRRHPVQLLRPTVVMLAVVTLLGWVGAGLPERSILGPWLPVAVLAVVGWYGFTYLSWRHDRLVVTDRRLLLISGLLSRRVAVMPLRKVTDLTYEQPLAGRLFDSYGWGTFVFESAGQDQAFHRIRFVPNPDELYHRLTDEIFGDNGIYGRARPAPAARTAPVQDRRDDED